MTFVLLSFHTVFAGYTWHFELLTAKLDHWLQLHANREKQVKSFLSHMGGGALISASAVLIQTPAEAAGP